MGQKEEAEARAKIFAPFQARAHGALEARERVRGRAIAACVCVRSCRGGAGERGADGSDGQGGDALPALPARRARQGDDGRRDGVGAVALDAPRSPRPPPALRRRPRQVARPAERTNRKRSQGGHNTASALTGGHHGTVRGSRAPPGLSSDGAKGGETGGVAGEARGESVAQARARGADRATGPRALL
eukprot:4405099-Prymnesium_polylepis.1